MNQRDVLPSLSEAGAHIELRAADHEEPTWEVHRPGAPRRRFDRRARMILTAAAIAALLANAGAAWAYWRWNGPEAPSEVAGTVFELALSGSSSASHTLRPGEVGDLTVTVTNQHSVPIRVTSIRQGAGPVIADETHRDTGCVDPPVQLTEGSFAVSWEVPKNTIGAFVLHRAITVRHGGPPACRDATYTVPVQARAERP
ncbi:hypothetical protein AB0M02_02535 [Actinoplanes sp. NPDC051861]|uniref:hypothetical protein n=1 Tax=Actinoplanes sp. NPDC051861 TaxID=3155170 RepID=UPI0034302EF8